MPSIKEFVLIRRAWDDYLLLVGIEWPGQLQLLTVRSGAMLGGVTPPAGVKVLWWDYQRR